MVLGGSTVVIGAEGAPRFVIGKGVANPEHREAIDGFLERAPREYRQAFESEEWSPGAVIRRFHSRSTKR